MEKISILIPTLNRDAFLKAALQSLVEQTYENWEAIIINNGDGEQTASLVAGFNDARLKYLFSPENTGECGGRNLALTMSKGSYVCYLDDDDLLPRNSLQLRLDFFKQFPECGMIYANYQLLYENSANQAAKQRKKTPSYRHKQYYHPLLKRLRYDRRGTLALLKKFNFIQGGTPLIRQKVLDVVGNFDERFLLYGDYDMWLRIARHFPIRYLNETVYTYRIHSGSITHRVRDPAIIRQNVLQLCQKHDIRRSVQFSNFQTDLDLWWSGQSFN